MNTELLLRVKAQILKEPKQFIMSDWFAHYNSIEECDIPNCGTAACIAGWAISLHEQCNPKEADNKARAFNIEREAIMALDLTYSGSRRLFIAQNWPMEYYHAWLRSNTAESKAQIAADRIDHFIATNEAE